MKVIVAEQIIGLLHHLLSSSQLTTEQIADYLGLPGAEIEFESNSESLTTVITCNGDTQRYTLKRE